MPNILLPIPLNTRAHALRNSENRPFTSLLPSTYTKKKPPLDGQKIQAERDATIDEETLLSWLDRYSTEKQRFLREQLPTDSLSERENLHEFFLSYVGAVYLSNGRSTRPVLGNWIIKLMSPSEVETKTGEGDVSATLSTESLPHYTPPLEDTMSTPPHTPPRVTPPQQSFTQSSLGSPIAGPSSNASNALVTGIVALLNQTASQKHVSCVYVYETEQEGAQNIVWITRCLINGQEKGCGRGSSKKIGREQAALQAMVQMGWISE